MQKEQVSLPREDYYLIIEKDILKDSVVTYSGKIDPLIKCPVQLNMKSSYFCVSHALGSRLKATAIFFGKATAIDMYKLYILEVSGQSSPSPPTFFTLHFRQRET